MFFSIPCCSIQILTYGDDVKKYQVIVLGAGPAGGASAAACARSGLKTALIEDYGFGGTCPLRGCNPKKIMTQTGDIIAWAAALEGKGIDKAPGIDWGKMARFRDGFVSGKKEKIRSAYEDLGIDTYLGRATFLDENQIQVGKDILEAKFFVLATGIKPARLGVPGEELISHSDDFLALTSLPDRICFIGGGFISFEFASLALRAGARVSMVHRGSRVLKQFDPDLSKALMQALVEEGLDLHLDSPLQSVSRKGSVLLVKAGQGRVNITADIVVHGAGRIPDVEGLNLDRANIDVSSKGIKVDRFMQCPGNPKFFAAGDVTDTSYALTPTGDLEGRVAAANIINPRSQACDYKGVPRVVYTSPPLCAVGLLEEEARSMGLTLQIIHEDMSGWFSWSGAGQKHAQCKILIDQNREVIIGAHMLGLGADEMANLFAMAVSLELSVKEMKKVLLAYPTRGYYFKNMLG